MIGLSVFQFTPLREGRQSAFDVFASSNISIHAPPRGATPQVLGGSCILCISIHAPPRGATQPLLPEVGGVDYFNSRPSARGDIRNILHPRIVEISIHAPPRGATTQLCDTWTESEFQFTPLREGRLRNSVRCTSVYLFQFTPLREGRQAACGNAGESKIFQFTPLREGRPRRFPDFLTTVLFQFTPLREGRHQHSILANHIGNFNSRPSARGDALVGTRRTKRRKNFNSRPSARGDVQDMLYTELMSDFNSRPSARGDGF